MNHLMEDQLNEYLDGELEAGSLESAEAHLAACAMCRDRLEELNSMTKALAGLPEESPSIDLAASVMRKLPEAKMRLGWKLALAAQAGVILGLLLLIPTAILPRWDIPNFEALPAIILPILELPRITLPSVSLPALDLEPTSSQLIFLAASALLLWGVGNALLLRRRNGARK